MGPKPPPVYRPFRCQTPALAVRVLTFVLAVWLGLYGRAEAQLTSIEPEIATSVTLSPSQRAEVAEFVDSYRADVFGENPGEAKRALEQLLVPLQVEGVSVSFRQAMADALIDDIENAIGDDRPTIPDPDGHPTINARPYTGLRLAGEIATGRTLAAIRSQLESEDVGRRFFAIHCTEMVFFAIRTSSPAVPGGSLLSETRGEAEGLVPDLGDRLLVETSPLHAAALVRALSDAGQISDSQMRGVAVYSIRLIAERTSERVRARRGRDADYGLDERKVWIAAGQAVFPVVAQPAGEVDRATSLASLRLAGHLIASVYRDVEADLADGQIEEASGEIRKQTLELARNLLTFGDRRHASATNRQPEQRLQQAASGLVEAFEGKGEQSFSQAALGLVSLNGLLTDAPYGFNDDEFIGR